VAVVAGMITSTFLTLVIVPVVYILISRKTAKPATHQTAAAQTDRKHEKPL